MPSPARGRGGALLDGPVGLPTATVKELGIWELFSDTDDGNPLGTFVPAAPSGGYRISPIGAACASCRGSQTSASGLCARIVPVHPYAVDNGVYASQRGRHAGQIYHSTVWQMLHTECDVTRFPRGSSRPYRPACPAASRSDGPAFAYQYTTEPMVTDMRVQRLPAYLYTFYAFSSVALVVLSPQHSCHTPTDPRVFTATMQSCWWRTCAYSWSSASASSPRARPRINYSRCDLTYCPPRHRMLSN
jgi:hypothetical protein